MKVREALPMVCICQFAPYFFMSLFCQCISRCFHLLIHHTVLKHTHKNTLCCVLIYSHSQHSLYFTTHAIIHIDEENVVRRVEFENMLRQGRHGIILQRGKGSISTCSLYGSVYNRLCNITSLSIVYCVTIIHNLTTKLA